MERKLILPTNWDDSLLGRVQAFAPAYLYGSLPGDPTLRSPLLLAATDENDIELQVGRARERGIKFTYVMNATCLGNREYSEDGRWQLLQRLEWLSGIGAAGVVTANPYVMELLAENFPALELHVSVLAGVDAPMKAIFFRDLGAKVIHLDPQINRDFRRLEAIRNAVDCSLSVLVNESCLLSCPVRQYHANMISHSAESIEGRYYVDYCYYKCSVARGTDPVQYLRSPWIRPEDLHCYESLGIDFFKVAGREKMGEGPSSHTGWITQVAQAYSSRRCEDVAALLVGLQTIETPFGSALEAPRVRIDSARLDGFLRYFRDGHCDLDCPTCKHCAAWAGRVVQVAGSRADYVGLLQSDLETVRVGSYWAGAR
ncbi:MAG: U32 family peptidase [Gammaproteobacteria bacterium]|nr:U32 family peptidase [Gammaproteobacteria bacterium]